jgi:DNA-binding beta-propeller fold protein YncE
MNQPRRARHHCIVLLAAAASTGGVMTLGCDEDGVAAGAPLRVEAVIGEVGTSPGQFVYPRCLDADADSIWVIDKTARVQRLDARTGRELAGWRMPDHDLGKPTGITIAPGPEGVPAVYIPDTHYQRVIVYSIPAGPGEPPRELARWGSYGKGPGQFIYPTDVAVLTEPDGRTVQRLYISEYGGNDRVSVFDARHEFLFAFGVPGEGAAAPHPGASPVHGADQVEFNRPQSIALDPARERMVVSDACNHRLGVFDLDGRLLRWIGSPDTVGNTPGHFNYPYGLALADDGTILVAEFGNHRVQRIDPGTGKSLGLFGTVGRGRGELMSPWGIAIIGPTAYVLDSGNNRVQAFPAPYRGPRREGAR